MLTIKVKTKDGLILEHHVAHTKEDANRIIKKLISSGIGRACWEFDVEWKS